MICSLCVYSIQFVLILEYCDELVTKSIFSWFRALWSSLGNIHTIPDSFRADTKSPGMEWNKSFTHIEHGAVVLAKRTWFNLIGHLRVSKTLTFKMRPSAQPYWIKWVSFAWEWKIVSISKAEHLTSFWYRGPGELGNGLQTYSANSMLYPIQTLWE